MAKTKKKKHKKRPKKERVIAVADCETDPFDGHIIPSPFLWGYYDGTNYEEFTTTDKFIEFIYTLPPTILYAHNGGKFDWHFILDYIEDLEKVMIINGRLAKFTIGEVEFRDSMNILPVSLKKMQKDEFDYNKMKADVRHKYMAEIKRYLYHDCLYLYQYVTGFIEQYGLHLTQAAAAMKTWESMTGHTAPDDRGGAIYKAFSEYYYGGRCEAFETGHITDAVSLYDINSAYPYAMLNKHPFGLQVAPLDYKEFLKLSPEQQGTCFMSVYCSSRGALPHRAIDMSLVFPNDTIKRVYKITGWEYLAARKTKTIHNVEVGEIWYCPDQIDFQDYILHFYERRQQAKANKDNAGDLFAKILMNSLYGKFGANPERYRTYMICDPRHLDSDGKVSDDELYIPRGKSVSFKRQGDWHYAGQLGSRHLVDRPLADDAQRYYNIMTAASITGYVRAMLWTAICACDGVVYCDTDSLFVRKARDLDLGDKLGQWKHEADFRTGAVGGKKLYGFETHDGKTKVASKGARLDIEDIYEIANGQVVEFEPIAPTFSVHHEPRFVKRKLRMKEKSIV